MKKVEPIEDIFYQMYLRIRGCKIDRLLKALKHMGYTNKEKRSDLYFKLLTCNRVDKESLLNSIKDNYINFDKVDL